LDKPWNKLTGGK